MRALYRSLAPGRKERVSLPLARLLGKGIRTGSLDRSGYLRALSVPSFTADGRTVVERRR